MTARPPAVRLVAVRQRWRDVVFVSWPARRQAIQRGLPAGLEADTHDEHAWMSLVLFALDAEPPVELPGLPGVKNAVQANLRTYVRGPDGEAGIHIFSTPVSSRALALAGRASQMPYTWAEGRLETLDRGRRRYSLQRRPGGEVFAEVEVEIGEWLPGGARTVFDRFITERFYAYWAAGPVLLRGGVEHAPWPLRRARVLRLEETLTRAAGLPAAHRRQDARIGHWSEGVDVRVGVPLPVAARAPAP